MVERRLVWSAWSLVLVLILYGSFVPAQPMPLDAVGQAVWHLAHIPVYALFLLLTLAMLRPGVDNALLVAAIAVTLFGLAVEIAQPLAGRSRSFNSYLANETGVVAGMLLVASWQWLQGRWPRGRA